MKLAPPGRKPEPRPDAPPPQNNTAISGLLPDGVRASPLARSLARANTIDLSAIKGSGPGGRIIKRDIEGFLTSPVPAPLPTYQPSSSVIPDKFIPLNRLRSAIGRRMSDSKQQVPHFYVTHEYDMAALMDLRSSINGEIGGDEKISVNDFIIKAAALTLRQYPNLNASLQNERIVQHGSVHMGIAVAVEGGLLTVACRNADIKSLRQISAEVRSLAQRAREGKVRPDDIQGSTFSISNLGMFDVEHFIAIINPPEAAILAIGSVLEQPVVKEGQIAVGIRMKATLSVDHRISDGVEAARFLQSLAEYLESPLKLLL